METVFQPTRTHRIAFALGLVTFAICVANLPVHSKITAGRGDIPILDRADEPFEAAIATAGFPWRAYERFDSLGISSNSWSVAALAGNALVALLAFGIVLLWIHCRLGTPASPRLRWLGERLSGGRMVALSLAVLIVATVGLKSIEMKRDRELANSLPPWSRTTSGVFIPSFLEQRVPDFLRAPWSQVRSLQISQANVLPVESALPELRYLGAMSIHHTKVSDELAIALGKLPLLRSLNFSRSDVSAIRPETIATWTRLTCLRINVSQLDPACLEQLVRLPNLTELDIHGTLDQFEKLPPIPSASKLETLRLNCLLSPLNASVERWSSSDQQPHISIRNLSRLRWLTVSSRRPQAIRLELHQLPQLRTVELSTELIVNLDGEGLPRLSMLHSIGGDRDLMEDDTVPQGVVFSKVRLRGVASLGSLQLHSRYIQHLDIQGSPNLSSLSLLRWRVENPNDRWGFRRKLSSEENLKPISDDDRFDCLVHQMSQIQSLRKLNLSDMDLQKVSLQPLSNLQRLNSLDLTGCELNEREVMGLASLESLTQLSLLHTNVNQETVEYLLSENPRWTQFRCNASIFDNLRLENLSSLQDFASPQRFRAQNVHLANLPNLYGELRFGKKLESLYLENIPRLHRLLIEQDIPATSVIRGVQELTTFEAGGPGVTDELMETIFRCAKLRSLIIRSGDVSLRTYQSLAQLRKLDTVHLPGAPIDDSMAAMWSSLVHLRDVVLNETDIGAETISELVRLKNLQRLSVNHTRLTPHDLKPLASVPSLIRLDVAGVGILPETLAEIARGGMLHQLDLSDVELSDAMVRTLQAPDLRRLSILRLRGSQLKDDEVRAIAQAMPEAVFEVPRDEFGRDVYRELVDAQRILPAGGGLVRLTRSGNAADAVLKAPYGGSNITEERILREFSTRGQRPRRVLPSL